MSNRNIKKSNHWSPPEHEKLYQLLKSLRDAEATTPTAPPLQGMGLWNLISDQLKVEGIIRSDQACRMYWTRVGRATYDFDERLEKNHPGSLTTSAGPSGTATQNPVMMSTRSSGRLENGGQKAQAESDTTSQQNAEGVLHSGIARNEGTTKRKTQSVSAKVPNNIRRVNKGLWGPAITQLKGRNGARPSLTAQMKHQLDRYFLLSKIDYSLNRIPRPAEMNLGAPLSEQSQNTSASVAQVIPGTESHHASGPVPNPEPLNPPKAPENPPGQASINAQVEADPYVRSGFKLSDKAYTSMTMVKLHEAKMEMKELEKLRVTDRMTGEHWAKNLGWKDRKGALENTLSSMTGFYF